MTTILILSRIPLQLYLSVYKFCLRDSLTKCRINIDNIYHINLGLLFQRQVFFTVIPSCKPMLKNVFGMTYLRHSSQATRYTVVVYTETEVQTLFIQDVEIGTKGRCIGTDTSYHLIFVGLGYYILSCSLTAAPV